ncbi:glycoside hydrolase superfamily [Cladorrhinum samala]|uniref:Beta-mannosidase B n=1 Tax=Cladorrhinum samala TaxID=585594 RepID=A0AAV9HQP0_9PEZI|nr:glycoside hydrolase superfamily [Cladorrhinum samala]
MSSYIELPGIGSRARRPSITSEASSSGTVRDQELGSMYDYLAKIILLGPSGTGKSCLLHRFVKSEWRVLSSQTIGVEFASKIIKVGTGARRKRIKLQLWDTAGTERFRSVSRSYYRGAAGAILVYDVTSHNSFNMLQPFLNDARALASPNLSLLLVGNKLDLAGDGTSRREGEDTDGDDEFFQPPTPSSVSSSTVSWRDREYGGRGGGGGGTVPSSYSSVSTIHGGLASQLKATIAPDGREVSAVEASRWASTVNIPVTMEVSALSGEGVDEVFGRLARMILTKIELGEIDPDDPMSGIQYGDSGAAWNAGASDGGSIKSTLTGEDVGMGGRRRRGKQRRSVIGGGGGALREWEETPIHDNWHFKQADKEDSQFLPVAQFPTNVHLDLLHHNLIPDPFIGKNELDVQWVGEAQWVYKTNFSAEHLPKDGAKAVIAFDGLDTFATVVLNGQTILETDNMFVPERVDVTSFLKEENELVISFDSAYLRGWKLVEQYPEHKWGVWNGDNSRLAVRKAQYHWGWDWGPALLTAGPWRPITLEIYETRIADLYFDTVVPEDLKSADIKATAEIEGSGGKVRFDLSLDGKEVASQTAEGTGSVSVSFHLDTPSLWYPIRYGKQPLYTLKATLVSGDSALDSVSKKLGLRRAELVQRPLKDQPGTSFFFQVNNIPLYCGGSDWIPADNFIPRITPQKYYDWVKLVADGNQFMIRVWGGGIYEEQAFYDACDELGVLVWQDFMFGCGNYPAWPAIRSSIDREARENVKLLRHHPSIVIWAGNNEDYQYQESAGLTYDYENKDAESWLETDFPARYIYEKILPDVCAELIPSTFYHPGSPWGQGRDTHDATVGDIHQWNVWHGTQEKWQDFDKLSGRFVSEFGMQAFPSVKTIDAYLPLGRDDPDRYPQSSTVDFHNKADGHERRIALYLVENMRYAPDPLEQFVYSTQLMQAECLASAYRLWKRQWKGPGREYCGGALVWQINDCWPVTSWSIADFYLRPKHAYFTVKREMAPVSAGITRKVHKHPRDKYTRVNVETRTQIEVWGSNLTLEDLVVDVVVKAWDVETGDEVSSQKVAEGLTLPENRSTEVAAMDVPVREQGKKEEEKIVVAAYIVDSKSGEQIARYVNWPEPLKYLHLQKKPEGLKAVLSDDAKFVQISADVPVKGVAVECEDDEVKFEDNLVDIVPGEVVKIGITGASKETKLDLRYLGMI